MTEDGWDKFKADSAALEQHWQETLEEKRPALERPDWSYWRQIIDVELWQAVALSFGLEPRVIEELMQAFYAGAKSDTMIRIKPRAKERLEIAESHRKAGRLPAADRTQIFESRESRPTQDRHWHPVHLQSFGVWAGSVKWDVPAEMKCTARNLLDYLRRVGISLHADEGNLRASGSISDELRELIRSHKAELLTMLTPEKKPVKEKPLRTRERETLLKLIIGMAVKGYGYDPAASRNDATREIAVDLEGLGIGVDADTVRKWLKEASELLSRTDLKP